MSDDDLTEQIRNELARIMPVVSELTGLSSNWNGQLVIVPDADFKGKKLYSCGILIARGLTTSDLRWRTLIHEALHAVSVGYSRSDYEDAVGWEEGVVEQLQRLLRQPILSRVSVQVDEQTFSVVEQDYPYNNYISALEVLRHLLDAGDPISFYRSLLLLPIKNRQGYVFSLGRRLVGADYLHFVRVFSISNQVLKKGVKRYVCLPDRCGTGRIDFTRVECAFSANG